MTKENHLECLACDYKTKKLEFWESVLYHWAVSAKSYYMGTDPQKALKMKLPRFDCPKCEQKDALYYKTLEDMMNNDIMEIIKQNQKKLSPY